ncbi:hypothetical protein CIB48_g7901 [Xylaria polymorpha]|nr:hypothetical protein CIB48_g7901 [Xylaria polymorpha]
MGGHRRGQTKGDTSKVRDAVDDRALVSLRQRPASPENAYLAISRSHLARGTGESTYSNEERASWFPASHSLSFSSSSETTAAIIGEQQHGLSQDQRVTPPSQGRRTNKPKELCHNWGNDGKCKFGKSCRYRHETPPPLPRGEPREVGGPAYYPSWEARGMQGVPVIMVPAFFPQESTHSRDQPRQIHDVSSSMSMNQFLLHSSNLGKGARIDTAHAPSGSSGVGYSTCIHHEHEPVRARAEASSRHISYSLDAFESKIAIDAAAAAEEAKWQRERPAWFKFNANKAEGGRRTSLPASSAGGNKKGYYPNQPPRNTNTFGAQSKNPGGKGEGKKGQARTSKAKGGRQTQQRKSQSSEGGQQPRGRSARAAPALCETQARRTSYSPDAFEAEIAILRTAAEEKWEREQARSTEAKATTGIADWVQKTNEESEDTVVSSERAETGGGEVENLIDL